MKRRMRKSLSRNRVAIEVLSNRFARSLLERSRLSFLLFSSAVIVCSSSLRDCSSSFEVSSSSFADCSSSLTERYSSFDDCSSSLSASSSSVTLRSRSLAPSRSLCRA